MLYTIDDLRDYAKSRGVTVSSRQVEEWHRAGLLPLASRPPIRGRRGRGPLQFPDPAPDAVVTLGRWRRYMTSDKLARIWLWLEGYDYIQGNADGLWAASCATIGNAWRSIQQEFPGVPDMPTQTKTSISPAQEDAILVVVEKLFARTIADGHESHDAAAAGLALGMALFGLDAREAWVDQHQRDGTTDDGDANNPQRSRLMQAWCKALDCPMPDVPLPDGEHLSMNTLLCAVALPRLVRQRVEWGAVRKTWRALCAACADPSPKAGTDPWMEWGCTIRRRAYGCGDMGLGMVIMGLVALCSLVPSDVTTHLEQRVLAVPQRAAS